MSRVGSYYRGGRLVHGYERFLGSISYPRPVRIDSPLYGKDQYGHVDSVTPDGMLHVRIEDPGEDHPAAQDIAADSGMPYDQMEFMDVVPHTKVRDAESGKTLGDPKAAIEQDRRERKRVAAAEKSRLGREAAARKLAASPRRKNELDYGLRSKMTKDLSEAERRSIFRGALAELRADPDGPLADEFRALAEGSEGPLERVPAELGESRVLSAAERRQRQAAARHRWDSALRAPSSSGVSSASPFGQFSKYDDDGLLKALRDPELTGKYRHQAKLAARMRGLLGGKSGPLSPEERDELASRVRVAKASGYSRTMFAKYDDDGLRHVLSDPELKGRHRREAEQEARQRGMLTRKVAGVSRVSEASRSRKSRTGKYTNVFHGTDKGKRTHADLLDEVAKAGHAGSGTCSNCGKAHDGPCPKIMEDDWLREDWSDAARAAALAARRAKSLKHGEHYDFPDGLRIERLKPNPKYPKTPQYHLSRISPNTGSIGGGFHTPEQVGRAAANASAQGTHPQSVGGSVRHPSATAAAARRPSPPRKKRGGRDSEWTFQRFG